MDTLFLALFAVGGSLLVLQLVLSMVGMGDHHDVPHDHGVIGHAEDVGQGLNLFSVRALSAGAAFFGLTGKALLGSLALWLVVPLAAAAGVAAMVGVAAIMRSMLRFEHDATVRIERAIGSAGTVYLRVPGNRQGAGKVTIALQGRSVEFRAITSQRELPNGTPVTVVDVVGPDTVEVIVTPSTQEILDGAVG